MRQPTDIDLGLPRRFEIRERLGSGGMGVVFRAFDRQRQEVVALKVLRSGDPTGLYRFKKEFRALANVAHPNLVQLHELIADGDQWLFTMELVDGTGFYEHVRPGSAKQAVGEAAAGLLDPRRLRDASRQLAQGIQALHDAGKLHRDLKPSNVLVKDDGRVVLLDFGLATELSPDRQTLDGGVAGTIVYMPPEQAKGEPLSAASDWYAFGALLFHALTADLPFRGAVFQVLVAKQEQEAPSPFEVAPEMPPEVVDLAELCSCLLARDPAERPTGDEILAVLGAGLEPTVMTPSRGGLLVGRQIQLDRLETAYGATRRGQAAVVYLQGPAGSGKTRLAEAFLDNLAEHAGAQILPGTCYEREMVPFKAVDGVIDSLARYLAGAGKAEAEALEPEYPDDLMRLFPVLERVWPHLRRGRSAADPLVARRRAFASLRGVLDDLARRHPLVIFIDDLHWADADSIALLNDLQRSPAPPLLLLAAFRSEDVASRPFLRELVAQAEAPAATHVSCIEVGPLGEGDVRTLISFLLSGPAASSEEVAASISLESGGNPFLVEQLARYAELRGGQLGGVRLVEMLAEGVRQLPDAARKLLTTLTVADRPLSLDVACDAAGLETDVQPHLAALRSASMVRMNDAGRRLALKSERLAVALTELVDAEERRRVHGRLLVALESRGVDDPEVLFEHVEGAGDLDRAAELALAAGRRAVQALAYDPAVRFLQRALELGLPKNENRFEVERELAMALAEGGRLDEAAERFLALAEQLEKASARAKRWTEPGVDPRAMILEMRCRAVTFFLIGGKLTKGFEVASEVLSQVGVELASTPRQAAAAFVFQRARLRLRGLSFTRRAESEVPVDDRMRIDACWAVACGLYQAHSLRSTILQTLQLRLALDAGEPRRLARAMAMEVGLLAAIGQTPRAADVLVQARELAASVDDSHAIGMVTLQGGLLDYFGIGDAKAAAAAFEEAEGIFLERCRGALWEVATCRRFTLTALALQGELAELARRLPVCLGEARARGYSTLLSSVRSRAFTVWLAADSPQEAHRQIDDTLATETGRAGAVDLNADLYNAWWAGVQVLLYEGEAEAAWERFCDGAESARRSQLMRIQLMRIEVAELEARLALARGAAGVETRAMLTLAARRRKRLLAEKGGRRDAKALAALVGAAHAYLEGGGRDMIGTLLEEAVAGFEASGRALHAAVARRRLGEVVGGEGGRRLIDKSEAWMTRQGIVRPEAMADLLAPGF